MFILRRRCHRPHYIHCRPTTCTNCNDRLHTLRALVLKRFFSYLLLLFLFTPCVSSFHQTWKRNVVELSDCGIHIGTFPVFASCCRGSATRLHFCREEGQLPDSCLFGWLTDVVVNEKGQVCFFPRLVAVLLRVVVHAFSFASLFRWLASMLTSWGV